MDFEEFTYGWKKWAQIYFDRYSAGELTFDQQRRARVWKAFELNGINLSKEENDRRFDIYWKAYEKEIRIFDDVIPVLETLKEKGIPMGRLQTAILPTSIGNWIPRNLQDILLI